MTRPALTAAAALVVVVAAAAAALVSSAGCRSAPGGGGDGGEGPAGSALPSAEREAARLRVTPMGDQAAALSFMVPADTALPPVPDGVDPAAWRAAVPADNASTPERVALGRRLYFDPHLSADGTVACATCHDVSRGFAEHRPVSVGVRQQPGHRNAPTTMNVALVAPLFHDGRAPTLEAQAVLPITNPIEMGQPDAAHAIAAITRLPDYTESFARAYGRAPNIDDVGRALAVFERTLMFLDAPFDRFARGQADALSPDARAGWALFNGRARCASCHAASAANPLFSDNRFHNTGVAARHSDFAALARRAVAALGQDDSVAALDRLALETDLSELGRFMVSRSAADVGAFRTPQLRNVGLTAPYMHDGSLATLWDVVEHFNHGGVANPYLDPGLGPLGLSPREVDQLVAFLFALSTERLADQNAEEYARQRALARARRP